MTYPNRLPKITHEPLRLAALWLTEPSIDLDGTLPKSIKSSRFGQTDTHG
jgi:hypothetical protein